MPHVKYSVMNAQKHRCLTHHLFISIFQILLDIFMIQLISGMEYFCDGQLRLAYLV